MQDSVKEKIEKRAYELFLKRGGVHGYAHEDWTQAEKEVNASLKAGKKIEIKPSAPAAPSKPSAAPAPVKPAAAPQKVAQKPASKNDKKR